MDAQHQLENQRPSPQNYTEPREYLLAVHSHVRSRNPNYSVRSWAKSLGYKTPSYLTQVLNGDKSVSLDLAVRIASQQNL